MHNSLTCNRCTGVYRCNFNDFVLVERRIIMSKSKPVEKNLMQEFMERQEKLFKMMFGREMTCEEKEHMKKNIKERIRIWANI